MTKYDFYQAIQKLKLAYESFRLTEQQMTAWYQLLLKKEIKGIDEIVNDFIENSKIPPQSPNHLLNCAWIRIKPEKVIASVKLTVGEINFLMDVLKEREKGVNKNTAMIHGIYQKLEESRRDFKDDSYLYEEQN